MIESCDVLKVLEWVTIAFCLITMALSLTAARMAYNLDKINNLYYAIFFMSAFYIYINNEYNGGTQIANDVSIMYRMFHLAIPALLGSFSIKKILACSKEQKWFNNHEERRNNV